MFACCLCVCAVWFFFFVCSHVCEREKTKICVRVLVFVCEWYDVYNFCVQFVYVCVCVCVFMCVVCALVRIYFDLFLCLQHYAESKANHEWSSMWGESLHLTCMCVCVCVYICVCVCIHACARLFVPLSVRVFSFVCHWTCESLFCVCVCVFVAQLSARMVLFVLCWHVHNNYGICGRFSFVQSDWRTWQDMHQMKEGQANGMMMGWRTVSSCRECYHMHSKINYCNRCNTYLTIQTNAMGRHDTTAVGW